MRVTSWSGEWPTANVKLYGLVIKVCDVCTHSYLLADLLFPACCVNDPVFCKHVLTADAAVTEILGSKCSRLLSCVMMSLTGSARTCRVEHHGVAGTCHPPHAQGLILEPKVSALPLKSHWQWCALLASNAAFALLMQMPADCATCLCANQFVHAVSFGLPSLAWLALTRQCGRVQGCWYTRHGLQAAAR